MTITIPEEHMRQMDISFCGKALKIVVTSDAKQIIINNLTLLSKVVGISTKMETDINMPI